MNKPHPDFAKVRDGFIRGGNHRDDIRGMIDLYRRFQSVSVMHRAIRTWEAGDGYILQLDEAATRLQREIESPAPDASRLSRASHSWYALIAAHSSTKKAHGSPGSSHGLS